MPHRLFAFAASRWCVVCDRGAEILTYVPALDNAGHGIRVNCVCPSWVDTPMVRQAIDGVEGLAQIIQQAVPIRRIATPAEVADAVIFLCSPRSSYVTGCGFIVDGGTTLTASR